MRAINGDADRNDFIKNCLKQTASGGTSIGLGLLAGLNNLGANDTQGSRVFILTDGKQGQSRTCHFV